MSVRIVDIRENYKADLIEVPQRLIEFTKMTTSSVARQSPMLSRDGTRVVGVRALLIPTDATGRADYPRSVSRRR